MITKCTPNIQSLPKNLDGPLCKVKKLSKMEKPQDQTHLSTAIIWPLKVFGKKRFILGGFYLFLALSQWKACACALWQPRYERALSYFIWKYERSLSIGWAHRKTPFDRGGINFHIFITQPTFLGLEILWTMHHNKFLMAKHFDNEMHCFS